MMSNKFKTNFLLKIGFITCLLFSLSFSLSAKNNLAGNASPYLAMHGDDPVNWHNWGPEALEKARKQNKMLFVSIGYFACHWCHVMQRESYSDKKIARLLNKHFISIKVDRELNPVLDERLIEFVQMTAGRAGWPLNVFLTPEGYPVIGMTYLPAENFSELIDNLQASWKKERQQLTQAAKEVDNVIAVSREAENRLTDRTLASLESEIISQGMQIADRMLGGFGDQTKFPMAPQLSAMLAAHARNPEPELGEFLNLTLDKMSRRGLFDHVGGGFYRYTVDPDWDTPHYEKMLYTSAMLAPLYFQAASIFDQPEYEDIAIRTLDYMLDEMSTKDGAFISSLSAVDNKGEEGGYYLWSTADLEKHFKGEQLNFANGVWDMLREPVSENGNLPQEAYEASNIKNVFSLDDAGLQKGLKQIRSKLKSVREKSRVIPKDDKRLTGWNGLALAALAAGSQHDKKFVTAGNQLKQFIASKLLKNGELVKAMDSRGGTIGKAGLFDYASISYGLSEWGIAQDDKAIMQLAHELTTAAWEKFYSAKGWRQSQVDLLPNPVYFRHIRDGALPSAEGLLIRATANVLSKNPDKQLDKKLRAVVAKSSHSLESEAFYYASLISAAVEIQK